MRILFPVQGTVFIERSKRRDSELKTCLCTRRTLSLTAPVLGRRRRRLRVAAPPVIATCWKLPSDGGGGEPGSRGPESHGPLSNAGRDFRERLHPPRRNGTARGRGKGLFRLSRWTGLSPLGDFRLGLSGLWVRLQLLPPAEPCHAW